jgi:indolepyruvate ferredoxin oxidoreductase, beta subunit
MTVKKLVQDPLNLIITGVGGQGNVVISLIIGNALVKSGYLVTIGETYGASQRGGPVMSHVRISGEAQFSPFIPEGCAHIILGMEPMETVRMLGRYGNPSVIAIVNPRPIYPLEVSAGYVEYPGPDKLMEIFKELTAKTWIINATEEAQKMGSPRFANVILIGALIASDVLPLDEKSIEPVLRETFPKEIKANVAAYRKGMDLLRQHPMNKRL